MDEREWRVAAAAVMVVAVAIGAVLGWVRAPEEPPAAPTELTAGPGSHRPDETTGPPSSEAGEITVHVAGAVERPGLVQLPPRARVADAITAAGGPATDAAMSGVNLAAPLVDGSQVLVPVEGEAPAPASGADEGLIRLNQADASQLETLPGVGPVLAERIIQHRDTNGPFQAVEDLLSVPGIGEAKLGSIRDLVAIP